MDETPFQIDWEEKKTAELLVKARRTGFFEQAIKDARWFQEQDGYRWDVALALSLKYWAM